MDKIIRIALDGPSGSGKSTIAKKLSSKLNILYYNIIVGKDILPYLSIFRRRKT